MMEIEERLFNDTAKLSHTRGARLVNVCRLCAYISQFSTNRMPISELGKIAERNGLEPFKGFSKSKVVSTRSRHYWYSLEKLKLVAKEGGEYCLLENGKIIAETTKQEGLDKGNETPDLAEASEKLRAELSRIIVESNYVRDVWLSLFMHKDDFSYDELLDQSSSITIELIAPEYRENLSDFGRSDRAFDSGYRIYPAARNIYEKLGIRSAFTNSPESPKIALILSHTARKELHEGIRHWTTYELGLTAEIPLLVGEREQGVVKTRREISIVRTHMNGDPDSLTRFAEFVRVLIRDQGNGKRIRIPHLLLELCHEKKISLVNAKQLLIALQKKFSHEFYFEGASEGVIFESDDEFSSAPQPWDYFVNIDGIWRPSIVLLENGG